jgi:hypothetical protein
MFSTFLLKNLLRSVSFNFSFIISFNSLNTCDSSILLFFRTFMDSREKALTNTTHSTQDNLGITILILIPILF